MELFRIKIDFSNVPSKYKTIYEWDDRYFTTFKAAKDAYWDDGKQSGCNVIVEFKKDPVEAKKQNWLGDWVEVQEHRSM